MRSRAPRAGRSRPSSTTSALDIESRGGLSLPTVWRTHVFAINAWHGCCCLISVIDSLCAFLPLLNSADSLGSQTMRIRGVHYRAAGGTLIT